MAIFICRGNSRHATLAKTWSIALLISTMLAPGAHGANASSGWGTVSGGNNPFTESAVTHNAEALTGLIVEQGQATQLPGSVLMSIGVYNQVDISGDNNDLSLTQDGENSGAVTTDTDISF